MERKKVGITLSGGAIRGVAHIGVLQALEDEGVEVDYVAGASAGSLVGCLFAAGYSAHKILEVFEDTSIFSLFTVGTPKLGFTDLSYIDKRVKELIPQNDFKALKRPFFASVTNLSTGKFEVIGEGELAKVVVASSSIPILFKAQKIGEDLYVDGGVLNNLPVEPIRPLVDVLIGVNVSPVRHSKKLDSLMEIGFRTLDLVTWNNVEPRLAQCDIVIEPGAQEYAFFELKKAKEIYEIGYEAAMECMDDICKALGVKRKSNGDPENSRISASSGPQTSEATEVEDKKVSALRRFFKKIRDFFRNLFN